MDTQEKHKHINYKKLSDEQLVNIIDGTMEWDKSAHSTIVNIILEVRQECSKELQSRYIGEEYLRFLKK